MISALFRFTTLVCTPNLVFATLMEMDMYRCLTCLCLLCRIRERRTLRLSRIFRYQTEHDRYYQAVSVPFFSTMRTYKRQTVTHITAHTVVKPRLRHGWYTASTVQYI